MGDLKLLAAELAMAGREALLTSEALHAAEAADARAMKRLHEAKETFDRACRMLVENAAPEPPAYTWARAAVEAHNRNAVQAAELDAIWRATRRIDADGHENGN